jgi:hypothetical protein
MAPVPVSVSKKNLSLLRVWRGRVSPSPRALLLFWVTAGAKLRLMAAEGRMVFLASGSATISIPTSKKIKETVAGPTAAV